MPQTTLYTRTGEEIGTIELPEALFSAPVLDVVIHQAVVMKF